MPVAKQYARKPLQNVFFDNLNILFAYTAKITKVPRIPFSRPEPVALLTQIKPVPKVAPAQQLTNALPVTFSGIAARRGSLRSSPGSCVGLSTTGSACEWKSKLVAGSHVLAHLCRYHTRIFRPTPLVVLI